MSAEEPGVRVELLDEAKDDLAALASEDREAALEAVRLMGKLRGNPYLGEKMRATPPRILEACRKLYFGPADRLGRPTLRLIYMNEPEDGAPQTALVIAVGERRRMVAHRRAARRLEERRRAGPEGW